jgi:hypothetical protein
VDLHADFRREVSGRRLEADRSRGAGDGSVEILQCSYLRAKTQQKVSDLRSGKNDAPVRSMKESQPPERRVDVLTVLFSSTDKQAVDQAATTCNVS